MYAIRSYYATEFWLRTGRCGCRFLYVITSYSIHYTKLYDDSRSYVVQKGDTIYFNGKRNFRIQNIYDGVSELLCRITSYNVCYTKLLRFSISLISSKIFCMASAKWSNSTIDSLSVGSIINVP